MKKENGLNQLNNELQNHRSFNLFYKNEFFARYDYDYELKRYQSWCGYLTTEAVFQIIKDTTETRKIIWLGD